MSAEDDFLVAVAELEFHVKGDARSEELLKHVRRTAYEMTFHSSSEGFETGYRTAGQSISHKLSSIESSLAQIRKELR